MISGRSEIICIGTGFGRQHSEKRRKPVRERLASWLRRRGVLSAEPFQQDVRPLARAFPDLAGMALAGPPAAPAFGLDKMPARWLTGQTGAIDWFNTEDRQ